MSQPQITEAEYVRQLMANSKEVACTCGSLFFKQVVTMRSVSRIFTGGAQDTLVPLPMFRCDDCGKPVEQMQIPDTKKVEPKKSSIITD